jgi:hypothetical protein
MTPTLADWYSEDYCGLLSVQTMFFAQHMKNNTAMMHTTAAMHKETSRSSDHLQIYNTHIIVTLLLNCCIIIRAVIINKHIGKKHGTSAKRLLHQTCKLQNESRPP